MRPIAIALLLCTAACSQNDQPIPVAATPAPIYRGPNDAQLPIDQQVAVLQEAETGCANQVTDVENDQPPVIPGGPGAAVHRELALQGSPANTVVGDAAFDTCMQSLGYQRLQ